MQLKALSHEDPNSKAAEHELIGVSDNIRKIRLLIDQVADTGLNVVVSGETGVGKELVVNSLYLKSDRVGKPFVKVNCAALPDTLLESEMFGYERGAFTGAVRTRRGKFEQANNGLLFLDEIGDMSLPLQSKLLHVLQGGDFTPLGSEKPVSADVWIIAATNRSLEQEIEKDNFRKDLFYRLSNIQIVIEPLRNRPEDIPVLVDFYISRYVAEYPTRAFSGLSAAAVDKLSAYTWPGNVRELQNVLKRIIVLGEGEETIDAMLLSANHPRPAPMKTSREAHLTRTIPFLPTENGQIDLASLSLKQVRKRASSQVEQTIISQVLLKTGWNRSKAARILKISYKSLLQKIEELEIAPPPELA
jgi:transcriptional regulator with PAS, ATPase and Fis domain